MLVILWEVSYQCWDGVCVVGGCSYASVRATHVHIATSYCMALYWSTEGLNPVLYRCGCTSILTCDVRIYV